jgi:hypothetical protein
MAKISGVDTDESTLTDWRIRICKYNQFSADITPPSEHVAARSAVRYIMWRKADGGPSELFSVLGPEALEERKLDGGNNVK